MPRLWCPVFCLLLCLHAAVAGASSAEVTTSGNFGRPGPQGEGCFLPDVINVVITSDDVTIFLEVSKSPRVTQDAAVYVIRDDREIRRVTTRKKETYGLYQDMHSGAAILVSCPVAGGQELRVEGTVTHEGRQYHLRHTNVTSSERGEYQLTEVAEDDVTGKAIEAVPLPGYPSSSQSLFTSGPAPEHTEGSTQGRGPDGEDTVHHRLRRQAMAMQNVYIDVSLIIAYDIYEKYFNDSGETTVEEKKEDAIERIKKHYALLMSEVDLHYQAIGNRLPFNISIQLSSFVIAQSAAASGWTEEHRQACNCSEGFTVETYGLWRDVRAWLLDTTSLPTMDYFVLFTGYNLVVNSSGATNLGLSYIGGVCASSERVTHPPGYNLAVVEDTRFSQTVIVTSHEIGHALGAPHDGDGNSCPANDKYTMTPSVPSITAANFGVFSSCSLSYFNDTFARLSSSSRSEACIHEVISPAGIPNVTDLVPGQVYDIQTQCERVFGNGSFVCPGLMVLGDTMCSRTYCTSPANPRMCYTTTLYRGTSCGDHKWCVNADCVSSPDAPGLDESCPFGDSRVPPYRNTNATCRQLVRQRPWLCYDAYFSTRCCQSCQDIKSNATGCEYGDKLSACRYVYRCQHSSLWESCCQSCAAYLTTASTTSGTTTAAAPATTLTTSAATTTTSATPTTTSATTTTTSATTTTTSATPTTTSATPTTTSATPTTTSATTTTTSAATTTISANTGATSSNNIGSTSVPTTKIAGVIYDSSDSAGRGHSASEAFSLFVAIVSTILCQLGHLI